MYFTRHDTKYIGMERDWRRGVGAIVRSLMWWLWCITNSILQCGWFGGSRLHHGILFRGAHSAAPMSIHLYRSSNICLSVIIGCRKIREAWSQVSPASSWIQGIPWTPKCSWLCQGSLLRNSRFIQLDGHGPSGSISRGSIQQMWT